MHQRKGKIIFIYFFLFLVVGSINNIEINKIKFDKVKSIDISGLNNFDNKTILKQIKNSNLGNIFFLNRDKLIEIIDSNTMVENFKIFKKYPSTIIIEIKKTNFLAKINFNDETFIVGSNGKLSENDMFINELPYIFGNPEISEFLIFKKIVDESKISYDQIKNLYFFKSKRWDIELKNNILIKLSRNNVKISLDNAFEFINSSNFENISIIDARIKNQIIIND